MDIYDVYNDTLRSTTELPVFDVGVYAYDGDGAFDSFKIMCNLKFNDMVGR